MIIHIEKEEEEEEKREEEETEREEEVHQSHALLLGFPLHSGVYKKELVRNFIENPDETLRYSPFLINQILFQRLT